MASQEDLEKSPALRAAQAAHEEATGKPRIFTWVHKEERDGEPVEMEISLVIPKKFKRFKFAKLGAEGNYIGALQVVFGAEALDPLDDWDIDAEEFELFMERLGEAISGTGNS